MRDNLNASRYAAVRAAVVPGFAFFGSTNDFSCLNELVNLNLIVSYFPFHSKTGQVRRGNGKT